MGPQLPGLVEPLAALTRVARASGEQSPGERFAALTAKKTFF